VQVALTVVFQNLCVSRVSQWCSWGLCSSRLCCHITVWLPDSLKTAMLSWNVVLSVTGLHWCVTVSQKKRNLFMLEVVFGRCLVLNVCWGIVYIKCDFPLFLQACVRISQEHFFSKCCSFFFCLAWNIWKFVSSVWQYAIVRYFKERDIYMNLNFCYRRVNWSCFFLHEFMLEHFFTKQEQVNLLPNMWVMEYSFW
jgi:hypothetical protein